MHPAGITAAQAFRLLSSVQTSDSVTALVEEFHLTLLNAEGGAA